jgi:hypothetical protein
MNALYVELAEISFLACTFVLAGTYELPTSATPTRDGMEVVGTSVADSGMNYVDVTS